MVAVTNTCISWTYSVKAEKNTSHCHCTCVPLMQCYKRLPESLWKRVASVQNPVAWAHLCGNNHARFPTHLEDTTRLEGPVTQTEGDGWRVWPRAYIWYILHRHQTDAANFPFAFGVGQRPTRHQETIRWARYSVYIVIIPKIRCCGDDQPP